jgi:hypothetical protein
VLGPSRARPPACLPAGGALIQAPCPRSGGRRTCKTRAAPSHTRLLRGRSRAARRGSVAGLPRGTRLPGRLQAVARNCTTACNGPLGVGAGRRTWKSAREGGCTRRWRRPRSAAARGSPSQPRGEPAGAGACAPISAGGGRRGAEGARARATNKARVQRRCAQTRGGRVRTKAAQSGEPRARASASPTTTSVARARVSATFSRRTSATKPRPAPCDQTTSRKSTML